MKSSQEPNVTFRTQVLTYAGKAGILERDLSYPFPTQEEKMMPTYYPRCWEDYSALKHKSNFEINQYFCFNSFESPKECHLSTITCLLPAQLLGFLQMLCKGESWTRVAKSKQLDRNSSALPCSVAPERYDLGRRRNLEMQQGCRLRPSPSHSTEPEPSCIISA